MSQPKKNDKRALWRPKLEELSQQCASCPFRQGNNDSWGAVLKRLAKAFGEKLPNKARVTLARIQIMSETEACGDFVCHGTAYKPDMTLRDKSEHKQCPGASEWFKKHGGKR